MASLEKEELAKGRQGQGLAKKDAASQQVSELHNCSDVSSIKGT